MKLLLTHFDSLPKITKRLIIIIIAVYAASFILPHKFFFVFGLIPHKVIHKFWLWQFLTYIFLHDGFLHLLVNVFMLWMFGRIIEPLWGGKKFLFYFLLTGAGAGVFNVIFDYGIRIPIIGASGAIFGLIAAFAIIMPNATVNLYFLFPVKAKYMALFLAVLEFAASFDASRKLVANLAHLGGMVTGFVYLKIYPQLRFKISLIKQKKEQLDFILDKINKKGIKSLTDKEKEILKKPKK